MKNSGITSLCLVQYREITTMPGSDFSLSSSSLIFDSVPNLTSKKQEYSLIAKFIIWQCPQTSRVTDYYEQETSNP